MTEVIESLKQNILKANEDIARLDIGTPEHSAAVKTVTELGRIYIEAETKDRERMRADESEVTRIRELEQKRDQQKWDNVFKIVTTGLNAAGKITGAIGVAVLIAYGIAYEKHDNVTSSILKQVMKDVIKIRV